MEESTNAKLVTSYLQAIADDNEEAILSKLHAAFKVVEPESLPFGGVYRGNEERIKLMQKIRTLYTSESFEIAAVYDAGSAIFCEFHMKGFGKAGTRNNSYTNILLEKYSCKDGKIAQVEVFFWDTHKMLEILQ